MKSLPQSYLNEINHNEKINESDVKDKIDLMDTLLGQAKELRKKGDHQTADMLCERASNHFDEFRKSHSLYDDIQKQWEKYEGDLKNLAQLKQDADAHDALIESKQSELNTLQDEKTKKWQKIKELEGALDKSEVTESPYDTYRDDMVTYAEKNDETYLEDIKKRREITKDLRKNKQIKDLEGGGVHMEGLNFKTVSKQAHDAFVKKTFKDDEIVTENYVNHSGPVTNLEVKKYAIDALMEKKQPLADNMILATQNHLKEMLAWIEKQYDEKDMTKKLYILQMINPDLFGFGWMDKADGDLRSYLKLGRDVFIRDIIEVSDPNSKAGLFLVQNV